ncbi:MAG TPA: outer membrane protein [Rhizobiaceae bacterium]
MKKLLLASTLLCAMSGYALAADAVVEVPEVYVAPVFSWTGGYIGGQVGYLWGDGDASGILFDDGQAEPEGWFGGVYVGYNYQFTNNVVLGIDADFAWTGADDDSTILLGGVPIGALHTELDWEGAVRARLGYAVDRFLPYVAGGVAFGKVDAEAFDTTGVSIASDDETNTGWTIGAGLEYAFTDNIIGRAEYRYTDFGDFDFGDDVSGDLKTNDVRLGIAYKF